MFDSILEELNIIVECKYSEAILNRLYALQYEVQIEDVPLLAFNIEKVTADIKRECNITEIPDDMKCTFIDMVCGMFLEMLYNTKRLNLSDFDFDDIITSVSMGGTSVTYDKTATDSGKFKALISALSRRDELVCYRKLKW